MLVYKYNVMHKATQFWLTHCEYWNRGDFWRDGCFRFQVVKQFSALQRLRSVQVGDILL